MKNSKLEDYKGLTFEQLLDEYYYLSDLLPNATNKGVELDLRRVEKELSKFKITKK